MRSNVSTRSKRRTKSEKQDFVHTHKEGPKAGKSFVKIPLKDHAGRPLRTTNGTLKYKLYGPFSTLDQAVAARDKHLAAERDGQRVVAGNTRRAMSVAEWVRFYLDVVAKNDVSRSSHLAYSEALQRYVLDPKGIYPLGHIPLLELGLSDVQSWREALKRAGVGAGMANYTLMRLKRALQTAVGRKETGLKLNPATGTTPRKTKRSTKHQGSSIEDYATLSAAISDYRQALPFFLLRTGLRQGELAGLHWGDIDFGRGEATLRWHLVDKGSERAGNHFAAFVPGTKTSEGEWETVKLSPETLSLLREHQQRLREHRLGRRSWRAGRVTQVYYAATSQSEDGPLFAVPANPTGAEALVFPSPSGTPYAGGAMRIWLRRVCLASGVTKTLHGCRHDCGSFMLRAGVSLAAVSKFLRHAHTGITASHYLHETAEEADTAPLAMDALLSRASATEVAV